MDDTDYLSFYFKDAERSTLYLYNSITLFLKNQYLMLNKLGDFTHFCVFLRSKNCI